MDVLDRPPSELPLEVQQNLLMELSLDNPTQRDWKGLADLLGFKATQIRLLAQQSNEDVMWKARTVLERWERACRRRGTGICTVRVLIYALAALDLQSCLEELKQYLHGQGCDVDSVVKEFRSKYGDKERLRSLFPALSTADVFPHPKSDRSHHNPAGTPGEVSTCSPADSVSPLRPVQPEEQFTCATPREYHRHTDHGDLYTASSSPCAPSAKREPSTRSRKEDGSRYVYISYHPDESPEKKRLIDQLANRLRSQGFTVFYDKYCEVDIQQQTLNGWKEGAITQSKSIVVVCTRKYCKDDAKFSAPRWARLRDNKLSVDSQLLRSFSYGGSREDSSRLIPVVLDNDSPADCLPVWLKAYRLYHWPDSENDDLLYCIKGVPKYVLPPLQKKKVVRPKQIYFADAPRWDPYDEPRHR